METKETIKLTLLEEKIQLNPQIEDSRDKILKEIGWWCSNS